MQDIKSTKEKNGPALQSILMAMRIRGYSAEHIAHDGRSRANLDAIRCRHWASIFPRIAPSDVMVINFGSKHRVVAL